jgi:hypothetical protein
MKIDRSFQDYKDRHTTICIVCGQEYWKRRGYYCSTACKRKLEPVQSVESST